MQDKRANIDLVFRNGLRNLEILPPAGVWDEIAPVAAGGARRRLYAGIAASVAIVAVLASSLWFVAGRLPGFSYPEALTLNQGERPTGYSVPAPVSVSSGIKESSVTAQKVNWVGAGSASVMNDTGASFRIDEEPFSEEIVPGMDFTRQISQEPDTDGQLLMQGALPVVFDAFSDQPGLSPVSEKVASRWQLGMGLTPAYIIKQSDGDPVMAKILESENSFITFSGGITMAFSFSNRLSLSTGINYSSVGQTIENIATYTGFAPFIPTKGRSDMTVATSAGTIVAGNPDLYLADRSAGRVSTAYGRDVFDPVKADLPYAGGDLVQKFGYLELPVMLRYKIVDRMFDLSLVGGVSYGLLVNNSVHANTLSGERITIGRTEGISPFSISSAMGVGLAYNLSGSISFNLEPVMRYNISTLGADNTSVPNPWSIGVLTGFWFRF